jgi:hypothetical protein
MISGTELTCKYCGETICSLSNCSLVSCSTANCSLDNCSHLMQEMDNCSLANCPSDIYPLDNYSPDIRPTDNCSPDINFNLVYIFCYSFTPGPAVAVHCFENEDYIYAFYKNMFNYYQHQFTNISSVNFIIINGYSATQK